jgi:alginate O-acetyltransferase complex protein AlgI
MRFNSLAFLAFLPLFALVYFTTRGRARMWVCLIGSYVFYGWWDYRFLSIILFSTLFDYTLGRLLSSKTDPVVRKRLLWLSLIANLGMLCVFKYLGFFVDSMVSVLGALGVSVRPVALHLILPIGISFYTFQTLSYTIDVYRRRIDAERSLLRFAVFIAFFPQLVAGPIVRAADLLPQMQRDKRASWENFVQGMELIIVGYFLKVVLGDSLAPLVDLRFENPEAHSSLSLIIGVVFYSFQIYGDFAGYSLIAIGVARLLGFAFPSNFNRPYFSSSFSEFWQRWHISLSSWLRDYLYIPLGGNRGGPARTHLNLMLTMLIGGLWHGASWTFVIWGGLHGSYLVLQRLLSEPLARLRLTLGPTVSQIGAVVSVFALTSLAWIFFRAPTLSGAWQILTKIASLEGITDLAGLPQRLSLFKGMLLISAVSTAELLSLHPGWSYQNAPKLRFASLALVTVSLPILGTFDGNSFIYFQF